MFTSYLGSEASLRLFPSLDQDTAIGFNFGWLAVDGIRLEERTSDGFERFEKCKREPDL